MRLLDIPKYQALGLLETLWHFAGVYAQRGDIGRHTNEEIAAWLGWKGDADTLMLALFNSKWIDAHEDPSVRWLVHGWADHADHATKQSVGRKKLGFMGNGVRTLFTHCATTERPLSDHCADTEHTPITQSAENNANREKSHSVEAPPGIRYRGLVSGAGPEAEAEAEKPTLPSDTQLGETPPEPAPVTPAASPPAKGVPKKPPEPEPSDPVANPQPPALRVIEPNGKPPPDVAARIAELAQTKPADLDPNHDPILRPKEANGDD